MSIRKKPVDLPTNEETLVEAVINKGGSVRTERQRAAKPKNYPLYFLQDDMRQRVEAARRKAPGIKPPSANEWINQAILDRLQREEQ